MVAEQSQALACLTAELVAELECLDRKWRIASKDFCATVNRSAKPSITGSKRPVVEIRESRKAVLSTT